MRQFAIVKYDYDGMPEDWKKDHPNIPYQGWKFVYLGEVPNMPGHCVCLSMNEGSTIILNSESIIEIPEDEL